MSPDSPETLKKWQDKKDFPFDLLSDPDHQVLEAWGAWGEKSMYGNKFMGVIRSHWIIDEDGTILEEHIKISPKKSIEKGLKSLS